MGKFYNVQPVIDPAGVVIDSALSTSSENPVQNKVVTNALNTKQDSTLSSAITIAGESKTTVEDALNALNSSKLESSDLGSAATLDVPTSGNASTTEVVKGDDTRLTDARTPVTHSHTVSEISDFPASMPASDVSSWAKAANKPAYDYSEIDNTPTLGSAAAKDVPTSGNATSSQVVLGGDTRLSDARTPVSHNHTVSEISDFPTLGTASALNVAASGNASTTEVVKGDDTRLSDTRSNPNSLKMYVGTSTELSSYTGSAAKNVYLKSAIYTISASGWSSSANSSGYYTYSLTTTSLNTTHRIDAYCSGADASTAPTAAQISAYRCICAPNGYADQTSSTACTLYAKTKPTDTFYMLLRGVYAS